MAQLKESLFEKQEVKVGDWDGDGNFMGKVLRFTGLELGQWTDHTPSRSNDDRGHTYTLFELPTGLFRLYIDRWSRWQGESSSAMLTDPRTLDDLREEWPSALSALGFPEEIDLDDETEE